MTNQIPTVICGGHDKIFSLDDRIGIGFGNAALVRDGQVIWKETAETEFDDCITGAQALSIAQREPQHDWRIIIDGPFSKVVYQCQYDAENGNYIWALLEKSEGFA